MLDELRILGDTPFDNIGEKDPLGYDEFVDSFVDIILNSKEATPFTIGIQGEWGVGKTTVMKRLQERLKEKECLTIWFNPWKYAEKEEVWRGLIKTVFDEFSSDTIEKILSEKKEILIKIVDTITKKLGLGETISELRDIFRLDTRFINEFESIMEEMITRHLEEKEKDLLVIFIDDLDRCRPECAIRILEAIKLYLCVPKCAFVIGFNRDVVDKGIETIYGKDSNINGTDYIKKIMQLPFKIPKPGKKEIAKYTKNCINKTGAKDIFSENGRIKIEYIKIIVQGTDSNPREIKRFLNSFVLLHNIKQEKMGRTYDPKKMIFLLLIQLRWNDLFRLIDKDGNLMILLHEYVRGDKRSREKLKDKLNPILENKDFLKFSRDNIPDFEDINELEKYLEHFMVPKIEKEPITEEEWINLLLTNVEEFNRLRLKKKLVFIDLRSAYLRGADLSDVNLRKANLRNANLKKANLVKANLVKANLVKANLVGAILSDADLSDADLCEADLRRAILVRANFSEANLRVANLVGANLTEANLWGANLREADLTDADLKEADLTDADLEGATLEDIKEWKNVRKFENTILIDVKELSEDDLEYAKKRGAILSKKTAKGES